jgi:hypothetical protein
MDLSKLQYFEKVESNSQKDFFNAHNNCILCGNTLELQHIRLEQSPNADAAMANEIKEEARCPHCDIRTRDKIYTLQ